MEEFAKKLREAREKKELSQRDIADAIGVSQPAYQYYEKGFKTPTLFVAKRICEALDISLDYLVGLEKK